MQCVLAWFTEEAAQTRWKPADWSSGRSDALVACDTRGLARAEGDRALLLTLLFRGLPLTCVLASPAVLPVASLCALEQKIILEARR